MDVRYLSLHIFVVVNIGDKDRLKKNAKRKFGTNQGRAALSDSLQKTLQQSGNFYYNFILNTMK